MTTSQSTYTAMLTDGPLEGKTVAVDFESSGGPRPTVEIPSGAKRYLYARTAGQEFEDSDQPSAVNYRYLSTEFD